MRRQSWFETIATTAIEGKSLAPLVRQALWDLDDRLSLDFLVAVPVGVTDCSKS